MNNFYDIDGLKFWGEEEILLRKHFEEIFIFKVKSALVDLIPSWKFFQIETPVLTPVSLIQPNYSFGLFFTQINPTLSNEKRTIVLRPEGAPGSYKLAKSLLSRQQKPPFVIWQTGKCFHKEQNQNNEERFTEHYKQEFHCFYLNDQKNDYHLAILDPVEAALKEITHLQTRIVEVGQIDKLPFYSSRTMNIEIQMEEGNWVTVISASLRKDFEKTSKALDLKVLEIAIDLDCCVATFPKRNKKHG